MKSVKSKRLRSIGLFIVLVALITSYYFNGFESKAPTINTRETDRLYSDLPNTQKIQLNLSLKSLDLLRKLISTKIEQQGAVKLSSVEQHSYGLYIYQVEAQNVPSILNDISEIGTITNKVEQVNTQNIAIDLDAKLRDREALYQKEFLDYNNSKTKYSYQLDRLKMLSQEVDSLKFEISNLKNKAMTLLYIKAQVVQGKVGKVRNYQKFVLDFIRYLIIFTVIVAFLHYGTVILVYLLSLLGIKFPSLTNYGGRGYNDYAGYKGYRGYGSYGYGGSRKRRVKRIYRSKQSSDKDKQEEEDK